MRDCDLCFQPTRNRKRNKTNWLLCNDCRNQMAYYDNLTPEERAREEQMIADYVAAHQGGDL